MLLYIEHINNTHLRPIPARRAVAWCCCQANDNIQYQWHRGTCTICNIRLSVDPPPPSQYLDFTEISCFHSRSGLCFVAIADFGWIYYNCSPQFQPSDNINYKSQGLTIEFLANAIVVYLCNLFQAEKVINKIIINSSDVQCCHNFIS